MEIVDGYGGLVVLYSAWSSNSTGCSRWFIYHKQPSTQPQYCFCLRLKMTLVHCHELERYITSFSLV
jgi:hypothetical protein